MKSPPLNERCKSVTTSCYVAKSRDQLLEDLSDDLTVLRWTPVVLVRDHPAIKPVRGQRNHVGSRKTRGTESHWH